MKKSLLFLAVTFFFSSALLAQPFFTTKGKEILDPKGKTFQIKGTNLGNWLVPEGYMFAFENASSPRLINQALMELIGPGETKAFWQKYLDTYITAADIHYLKQIGMNSIRIPFNYRLFTNENYMGANNPNRGFVFWTK